MCLALVIRTNKKSRNIIRKMVNSMQLLGDFFQICVSFAVQNIEKISSKVK